MRRLPGDSRTPSAAAMVGTTRVGSVSGERSTKTTPSGKRRVIAAATAMASRVLPTPPGPVSVSNRTSSSCSLACSAATSVSRPMSRVSGAGKRRGERGLARCGAVLPEAGRAAASSAARSSLPKRQAIGQQAHGLQPGSVACSPRSRSLMPFRLSPARSARSSWDSAAALRNRRSSSPNDVVVSLIAALPGSPRWLIRGVLWCAPAA